MSQGPDLDAVPELCKLLVDFYQLLLEAPSRLLALLVVTLQLLVPWMALTTSDPLKNTPIKYDPLKRNLRD